MRIINYILVIVVLVSARTTHAQHYQFSQFYAAQTYLNPAFAGANVCSRLSLNYRNQWAGVPGGFTTYQLSFDHYLRNVKSGVGLLVFNDKAGLGSLKTTQVSMQYAYEVKINREFMGRGGISFGGVQRSINFNALTFGDQIARGGASSSVESLPGEKIMYFDLGAGVLFYSKNYWGGMAVAHMNNPNQSLLDALSPLPPEIKLHGGYRYTIYETAANSKEINAVTFAFNYKKQRAFNQLDLGVYYSKDYIVFGMWYRGIPIYKPRSGYRNNDAVIFLLGLSVDKFKVGYSYDVTISKLTNLNSLGSHEISMSYQFCSPKKRKQKRILVSCPKF